MMLRHAGTVAALALLVGCGGIGNAQGNLRSAIDAKQATLDDCYETALERDKTVSGAMTVYVHVAEDSGEVTQIEMTDSSVSDPSLNQCVESTLVGTKIDPPGSNLKVEYLIEFTPET